MKIAILFLFQLPKKLLLFSSFLCIGTLFSQISCPTLLDPLDNGTNIAVDTEISWNDVGAPAYRISIGTTLGGNEITNEQNIGNATSFKPPVGLPENTTIYIRLTIFFFNTPDPDIVCDVGSFQTIDITAPPPCATINSPIDGATDVNVSTTINWPYIPTSEDYFITIGTTPEGDELVNNINVGNVLSYKPSTDLPFNTTIYVQITPSNSNGPASSSCTRFSFTTGAMAILPNCTSLISPSNGAINVPLTPFLEWEPVSNATGYYVTIGLSPTTSEILDNSAFSNNSTFVVNFDPNRTFFIKIIPFNAAGNAIGCSQETFSTILGCGPYLDATTGEMIDLAPEISLPDSFSFCKEEAPFTISTQDQAEGYRWFQIDTNGNENLISTATTINLNEAGNYRYEAFNNLTQSGNTIECAKSKEFIVTISEPAIITSLDITGLNGNIQITTQVTGIGNYEYALNNSNGPYQDNNQFVNLPNGSYTVFVRDKNGCGIAEESIVQDLTIEGFPKFFTPNGDGINDYWQFIPPQDTGEINIGIIEIYDRWGRLLKQIKPLTIGWDGLFNGKPLPSSDYWFTAVSLISQKKIKGHFSLKR